MAKIDIDAMASQMAGAFFTSLKPYASDLEQYAQIEARKFATALAGIADLVASGTIDQDEAQLHLQIQENASRAVFTAIQGIGLLAAASAINAAIAVVKDVVNEAIGFVLIP